MAEASGKKSGSENRERKKLLQIRVTEDELAEIAAVADRAQLTVPSYARQILLDAPPPRARRRPSVDTQQVAKLLGELGKVGSNLNQIAHHLNAGAGGAGSNAIASAIEDVQAMRNECMKALGHKP